MEAILDDHLGEDHVGLCILYYLGTMSTIMTIWKWPLFYIFFIVFFLQKHLITHNEGHVPSVDEMGTISVKKKKKTFHERKRDSCDYEGATSKIEKVLFKEFV
jgi:hypothetical protein